MYSISNSFYQCQKITAGHKKFLKNRIDKFAKIQKSHYNFPINFIEKRTKCTIFCWKIETGFIL